MKRWTASVMTAALLGLAAYTLADAQAAPEGQTQERVERPGGRGFGRGHLPMLRGVDLTDQQREQIRSILEAERPQAPAGSPGDGNLHRQLEAELFADSPDMQKVAGLQARIAEAAAARLERHIAIQQKVAQVLTAEQRASLRERLAQAPERRPARGGRLRGPAGGHKPEAQL